MSGACRRRFGSPAALCERTGEEFPETCGAASELIERLRTENGDPRAKLRKRARGGGFKEVQANC